MKLTLKGFKAVDREIDLQRLNLISAPNGSGKSAIADAIRFLALGYVPALGKTEAATALLMSNGELSVTLTLEDGRTAQRTLTRDAKAIVSTVRASWVKGSRAEHEAAILKLFGSDAEDVAEALDIRELLSLSPAKRAARIEKMVGSGGEADELPRRVARHHIARLLDLDTEQLPEKLSTAISNLPLSRQQVLRELAPTVTANLRAEGLPSVIAWANASKREAEVAAKKRHAAKDEIEARLSTLSGTLAIDELEAQRDTLQRAIGAQGEVGRREATRSKQYEAAMSEKAQLEPTLEQAIAQLDRIETMAKEMVAACEEKIPGYDEEIGALRSQVFTTSKDADRVHELEQQVAALTPEPVEDVTRYERMVEDFEKELADAQASPWAEVRQIATDIAGHGEEYRSIAKASARLIELSDTNMPSTADTEAALTAARETLQKRGDASAEASLRNVDRETKRALLLQEIAELEGKGQAATASVKERERKRDIEIEGLTTKKRVAKETIAEQKIKVDAQRNHVQTIREKLSGLTARVLALSNPIELPEAPDMGELDRINTAIEAATSRASLKSEFELIVADIEVRDATVDVLRALEYALTRVREEDLAEKGGGIVARISDFLQAAGRTELPYMEASKNLTEIGWVRGDKRRVAVEAMSGGEFSLFCAALTAAVLSLRGGELRVLMIEAAEADDTVFFDLMAGIKAMPSITTALVLTAHGPFIDPDNEWRHVELEQVAA